MTKILQHTFASSADNETNILRHISLSSDDFNKIKESESSGELFGVNSKDVIEFSAFTQSNELVGWKTIEQAPSYATKNITYLNTSGELENKTVSYLQSLYPKTKNGEVIISPKHELGLLGIEQGEYKVRISYKNDVVGSFDNPYKFEIKEISSSRTEIKAVAQSFKNSVNPNQVSFNFEYSNFTNRRIVVAHLIEKIKDLLLTKSFKDELETKEFSAKTSDYELYIEKTKKAFSLSELEVLTELDSIYANLKDTYTNFLYGSYNEVFTEGRFYTEFVNLVDYTLSTFSRFVQEDNKDIRLFYKFMLLQMYDESVITNIYKKRFDTYLNNGMNFGNGLYIPFLRYTSYKDDSLAENSNDILLIKLLTPLDDNIEEGVNFYISQTPYSDDIIKSLVLRTISEKSSNTFKLRGPNISTKLTSNSTKKYSLSDEEKTELVGRDETSAENFFKTTNTEIENLNIDYSDFKNFVKYSSARSRLDNFILKLTNISKLKFKINETIRSINKLDRDVAEGLIGANEANRSKEVLKNEDIKKYNESIIEIFKSFTPYDKFLYFDDNEAAWPRETSFQISGFVGKNNYLIKSANGFYKLHASRKYDIDKVFINEDNHSWQIQWDSLVSKWKLSHEDTDDYIYSNNSNLNSGFTASETNQSGFDSESSLFKLGTLEDDYTQGKAVFPPELIPTTVIDFQKTEGYNWYQLKAREADLYDKYNDDSLRNSIPEFLVRTNENDEFTLFLDMIGEQFDILSVYAENMREVSYARNSLNKGIPNQLVWFVMNSFGVRLSGRTTDDSTIGKQFEENRDLVWRRILNNLPYILKTTGTENSIRALFRCYGIPDHLFKIREYGGINYNTDTEDSDANFKISTFDYSLKIDESDQYLRIPIDFSKSNTNSCALEMKLTTHAEFFEQIQNTETFNEENSCTLPADSGIPVSISNLINSEDDYIINSTSPTFYSKHKDEVSFVPEKWKHTKSTMAISWKNFREGVSFSYPHVTEGTQASFVTIYSDSAKKIRKNKEGEDEYYYDPLYTLAEIGAHDTLNGEIVRLSFGLSHQYVNDDNQSDKFRNNLHSIDFRYEGSVEGEHYTISELRSRGYSKNNGYYPIIQSNRSWDFGIYKNENFRDNYGKFYINFYNTDGVILCPDKNSNPIYFDKDVEYDILINCRTSNIETDSKISIHVKRVYDSEEIFSSEIDMLVSEFTSLRVFKTTRLYFGNYDVVTKFRGTLDKLRIYSDEVSEKRFLSHINNNQGYDLDDYLKLENALQVKVNFDHPYSLVNDTKHTVFKSAIIGSDIDENGKGEYSGQINSDSLRDYVEGSRVIISFEKDNKEEKIETVINSNTGVLRFNLQRDYNIELVNKPSIRLSSATNSIKNYALADGSEDITAYNFNKTEYPYNFVGKNRTEISNLPSMGAKSFNNNKIRIETQTKVSQLSPIARATKKSKDRHPVDSNNLGVYFSPTDIVNQEIIRFFGQINMGDFIGDPQETYSHYYKKFEGLRRVFFKHGFGKLDIQKYFNLIKSYIDPSLFENLEKIVPARANLISGLLVEPSLLERNKIIPPRIQSGTWIDLEEDDVSDKKKIQEILNIDFKIGNGRNNISTFGNERLYIKNKNTDYKLTHESAIKVFDNQSESTYNYNYSGSLIGEDIKDSTRDLFTINGLTEHKGNLCRVEELNEEKEIGIQYNGKLVNYDIFLNDGIQIMGLKFGLESANGVYEFIFKGNSGLPVFANQNRKWWVFYSSQKNRWILASDNTIDGGKYLALNRNKKFENYIWLGGNRIIDSNTNSPEWFSTGFNNSIESDNLPNEKADYFGRVNFVSRYNRFIDCDAYLQGWVNAELYGIYDGELIERVFIDSNTFENVKKPKQEYIFSGEKKYVYFNGNFRGKLQNGWVGSKQIQQENSNKIIRIIGFFDGKNHDSCEKPYYTSGEINSLVSFDNRDKLVFDYRNFDSNNVRYTKKNFKNFNLVKVPNKINFDNKFDFKFISDFNIKNQGISDLVDLASGELNKDYTIQTTDIFYSPSLYKISTKYNLNLRTNSILDVKFIAKKISYRIKNSDVILKLKNSTLKFNFTNNEFNGNEIISRGEDFQVGSIYNQAGEKLRGNAKELIADVKKSINYKVHTETSTQADKVIENENDFCLVVAGDSLDDFNFIFMVVLGKKVEFQTNMDNQNFFNNTYIKKVEKQTSHEPTPMHINKIPQFVRKIEFIESGLGYIGDEIVEVYGKRPINWKSSWPQKLKADSLFNIDRDTGEIKGVKFDNFLISGLNWITDETISYIDTPLIKIEKPIKSERFTKREPAELRIVTGEPTPQVSAKVTLQNFVNLELGDTIGKSLRSANMFFEGSELIRYDTGLIHTKQTNIQTSEKRSSRRLNSTEVIVFSNESILNFEMYLDSKIRDIMRMDICGNETPITSDTYDIQINNYINEDIDEVDYDISYVKNREVVNNFFVILNELEAKDHEEQINDEQYINKISKINENRFSSGYIRINGFNTNQSTANGIYRFRNDISYCDKFGSNNVPIPTYTNENKEWIITYDEDIKKWKLRNIKTFDFIVSKTKFIEDGFLASESNNQGFYTGREVILKPEFKVDRNGIVFDEDGNIIGNTFQEANVNVSNRFKIVPNKLLFRLNKENFNNFLMWKVQITSKTNKKFVFEMPIVYINSDSNDELFLTKYNNLEDKLKQLSVTQFQETSECSLNFQNAISWKIKLYNENKGEFSATKKIKTQGVTYLNSTCFSKIIDTDVEGRYSYVADKIINDKSTLLEYSEYYKQWKLKTIDRSVTLSMNKKYPKCGVYKTTTKNIYGICEYEKADDSGNLAIRFRNFDEEYENANGLYFSYGYLETGEHLFRNENSNWLFYTSDGGNTWDVRDDRNYPSFKIERYSEIEQVGVYTDSTENIKVFLNFEVDFEFENKRDFLDVDKDTLALKSNLNKILVYNKTGYEKDVSNDMNLDVRIDIVNAKKKSEYWSSIPCKNQKNINDLYMHNNLFLKTTNEIFVDEDGNDNFQIELNVNKTKNVLSEYKHFKTNLSNIEETKTIDVGELYSNKFSTSIKYKVGDIVFLNEMMWECKKDIPENRSVIPGIDFDTGNHWKIISKNFTELHVTTKIEIEKKKYRDITKINNHDFHFTKEFVKLFKSKNQLENGIDEDFESSIFKRYKTDKKYMPFDLGNIGKHKDIIPHGRVKTHTYNTYTRNMGVSDNTTDTTIDKSGYLCGKPTIVRTYKKNEDRKEEYRKDSFWFNQDKKHTRTSEPQNLYEKPEQEPIISFRFEKFDVLKNISLMVSGFTTDQTKDSNGKYEQINSSYNDTNVYKNDKGYIIYKTNQCWILIKSNKPMELSELIDSNLDYTTSESKKIDGELNGNFGSSANFTNQVGLVKILTDEIIEKTPTPTPEVTPTPTQTPTPSLMDDESPDNPIAKATPTPTQTSTPTQTPKEKTPTPVSKEEEKLFLYEFNDFAITSKKYDLSKNPEEVEKEIKEDLDDNKIIVSGLMSVEELSERESVLTKIPNSIENFGVKVAGYSKMIDDDLITKDNVTKYGWTSTGAVLKGKFRSFYVSRNKAGRTHKYDNQNIFAEYGYYIKSWFGPRPVAVKLLNQTAAVTDLEATSGLPEGVKLTWKPSFNATYIRIEYKNKSSSEWKVLEDKISQIRATGGYLDSDINLDEERTYRVISVGLSGKETISEEVTGWKLGIPSAPEYVNASYDKFADKIELSWDGSGLNSQFNKTDGYTILRSETNEFEDFSTYQVVATDIKDSNYVDVFSFTPNKIFWYIVVANNEKTKIMTSEEYNKKKNWSKSVAGKTK